jgi:EAL domain-containing protein (putative c-di-GMP-specific phosphodiesterase class I)
VCDFTHRIGAAGGRLHPQNLYSACSFRIPELRKVCFGAETCSCRIEALRHMPLFTDDRLHLRRAMARDQLVLHCQPVVDCETGEVEGAEALIRWQHPGRGLLAPKSFLPSVSSRRLGTQLNLHILELALAERDRWDGPARDLPLSVNVTPACLADEQFLAGVERLFEHRSPEGEIRLEVTEQATVGSGIDVSVARLRSHGFEFLLDDFGAEYSSLSRLAQLPFSTLKIDGSLVDGLATCHAHRSIVHASINLAHTLGLKAVAERVESMATWKLLHALGCDQIQGYLVARPMPADRFSAWVRHYEPAAPAQLHPRERRILRDRRLTATAP